MLQRSQQPAATHSPTEIFTQKECIGRRSFRLRRTERRDVDQLRLLHDASFPIKYPDTFYEIIFQPQWVSFVAVVPVSTEEWQLFGHPAEAFAASGGELIVGFITGRCKLLATVAIPLPVAYVSTIGVDVCARRGGVGGALIHAFFDATLGFFATGASNPEAGFWQKLIHTPPLAAAAIVVIRAVSAIERIFLRRRSWVPSEELIFGPRRVTQTWLHVLATNTAVAFYERLGFVVKERLPAFFDFDGRHHDAFLMAIVPKALWAQRGGLSVSLFSVATTPWNPSACFDEIELADAGAFSQWVICGGASLIACIAMLGVVLYWMFSGPARSSGQI